MDEYFFLFHRGISQDQDRPTQVREIVTNRVGTRGKVIACVCFHSVFRNDGPLALIFCTCVSQYQKSKTNLDFTEARDTQWQWHQLTRRNLYFLLAKQYASADISCRACHVSQCVCLSVTQAYWYCMPIETAAGIELILYAYGFLLTYNVLWCKGISV